VPVGHTRFSWLLCTDTSAVVPHSHTRYSWISQNTQPALGQRGDLAEKISGPSEHGAETRTAQRPVEAAHPTTDRRRRRRTSSRSDTNSRLLDPALATHLANSAIDRRQRAPEPWPVPLQPQSRLQRIIIGLGSGRCGTQSLTELFSAQPDCWAEHEMIVNSSMLEWEARKLAGQRCESNKVRACLFRSLSFIRKTNRCDAKHR
jgi:hypothetical protein